MAVHSAGILLFRLRNGRLELFLARPGGPYFVNRDRGVWSIPKGLGEGDETLLDTAKREFEEETGFAVDGAFMDLGSVRLRSGKMVHAWGLEGDVDASQAVSNTFEMEWPKHSGRMQAFPEMDEAAWFSVDEARVRITPGQLPFIDRLLEQLGARGRLA